MSTISSALRENSDVAVNNSNKKPIKIVDKSKIGFNALGSEDFLKLLVVQLQNQDPTAPTSNEEILRQLSSLRSLQADTELSDGLKSLTKNQNIASGATFLGKLVTGFVKDSKGRDVEVSGIVDRVFQDDGELSLASGQDVIKLSKLTSVQLVDPT